MINLGYQARIKIVQIPAHSELQILRNPRTKEEIKIDKTWLYDPFLNHSIYGLEIEINDSFSWTFFLNSDKERNARILGYKFLNDLEERFVGLSGQINVLELNSQNNNSNSKLFELILPRINYIEGQKFEIINKFVHLFGKIRNTTIRLFVIWQKDDSLYRNGINGNSPDEIYKIKIYISIQPNMKKFQYNEKFLDELQGRFESIELNIRNLLGDKAEISSVNDISFEDVLKENVFWMNTEKINTGPYYAHIYDKLPKYKIPAFLSPDQIDFHFPDDIALPKANIFEYEYTKFSSDTESGNHLIKIGKYVKNGIPQTVKKKLSLDDFAQSMIIGGQPGTGKTSFLAHLSQEFYKKAPHVGVLYLNLGKGNQEIYYKYDSIIKYGSPECKIPYFVRSPYLDKSIQETASYLIASLGLNDPVDRVLYVVMKSFIRKYGHLPHSIKILFRGLLEWYKKKPYHDKYQKNILRAIENRVFSLFSDKILGDVLKYDSETPEWFKLVKERKKVYLDLSMCNLFIKRLLVNAILQMFRTLIPDLDIHGLRYIIIIDEAHQIAEKPRTSDVNDFEYISKNQLEKIFNILLREFRGKGLGMILADQTPSDLFNCATKNPSLKILFRLGDECIRRFTYNEKDYQFLSLLKNRHALVLDGVSGQKYVIETLDFEPKRIQTQRK